jgi:uncharacterized membrane protein (UPF0136 family)
MTVVAASFFLVFGLLSIAGGVIGWKRAGSKASLIAGGLSGVLLLAAAASVFAGEEVVGLGVGGVTALLLAGRFVPAYLKTRKSMPQGMMAFCSLVALALTAAAWQG